MTVTAIAVEPFMQTTTDSTSSTVGKLRRLGAPLLLTPLFLTAGCHWAFAWAGEAHGEATIQACEDEYDQCMSEAQDGFDRDWCQFERDWCFEECPEFDDGGGYGDDGGDDGYGDDGGGDDGGADDGGGTPDVPPDDDIPQVCFDLHQSCIEQAQSLQDVEACEALFEHCADPGECDHDCPNAGCPQLELDACLDEYSACTYEADTQSEVDACGSVFDACTAAFDTSECLPEDDGRLDQCLEEHALCVKCGETPEHFEACKEVFDSCMAAEPIE
jgi:hypothetical protein